MERRSSRSTVQLPHQEEECPTPLTCGAESPVGVVLVKPHCRFLKEVKRVFLARAYMRSISLKPCEKPG